MQSERNFFHWALIASLLLHLILLFLVVPGVRSVWPESPEPLVQLAEKQPDSAQPPLEFEFVDLANDREEKPDNPDTAKLSDMDRRAHGGQGASANTPSSRGNTPQLVQAEGGDVFASGAPPQQPGPQVPQPQPEQQEQKPTENRQSDHQPRPEGAGERDEAVPTPIPQAPRIQLPPPGAWTLPNKTGGLPENPDRAGGSVDTGGLSFDTQWYDWGPYAKLMLAKIRRNWRIPEIARLGVPGSVRIRFFIERDGTVTGLQILDVSGKPPMDNAAEQAITLSSPFQPLPPDLVGVDHEGVIIRFYYNSRPPEHSGQ